MLSVNCESAIAKTVNGQIELPTGIVTLPTWEDRLTAGFSTDDYAIYNRTAYRWSASGELLPTSVYNESLLYVMSGLVDPDDEDDPWLIAVDGVWGSATSDGTKVIITGGANVAGYSYVYRTPVTIPNKIYECGLIGVSCDAGATPAATHNIRNAAKTICLSLHDATNGAVALYDVNSNATVGVTTKTTIDDAAEHWFEQITNTVSGLTETYIDHVLVAAAEYGTFYAGGANIINWGDNAVDRQVTITLRQYKLYSWG